MSAEREAIPQLAAPLGEDAAFEPRMHQAAEAIADGGRLPAVGEAEAPSLLAELDIIARVAQAHRRAARAHDDAGGEESSDSLGDVLSRSIAPASSRPDLTHARRWGPLFVLERVGGGSFGEVYRAWDPALDREVALKLLRLPSASTDRATAFVREGQLLASVHHPNVINVHGAAQIEGEVGIWMEFVRGRTLERIVLEDGPMSAQEAAVIAESLCGALAAVHQQGLLHRDIKAANVMRASGGRIVLLDFGTGTEAESSGGGAHRLAGTPLYMAPEVLAGGPATVQSDIYSLGVLLFFLVTGSFPVYGKTLADVRAAHAKGARVLLSDVRSDLPAGFVRAAERATDADPGKRPPTAATLALGFVPPPPALTQTTSPSIPAGVWYVGVAAAGPWTLGLLMSLAFNTTLGRGSEFSQESVFAYWVWGARSLVAPAAYAGAVAVAAQVACALGRLFRPLAVRLLPTPHGPAGGAGELATWFSLSGVARADVARMAVPLQVATLAALCWLHRDVLQAAMEFAAAAAPERFAVLRPSNSVPRTLFAMSFTVATLAMGVLWWRLLKPQDQRHRPDRATAVVGIGLAVVTLIVLTLPYRIVWHSKFERVLLDGHRCYVIGANGVAMLLHCPEAMPVGNRIVRLGDPRVQHTGIVESIFAGE